MALRQPPRIDRAFQVGCALLLSLSLAAWAARFSGIFLGWFLGWPLLLKWIASVPWSIDAARIINAPAFLRGLHVSWIAALVPVAFLVAAELEAWTLAGASARIPERLGHALRSIEERVRPLAYAALFIDGPLGALTLCEVRWRPFRRPILIVSRATLDSLDDAASSCSRSCAVRRSRQTGTPRNSWAQNRC